MKPLTQIPHLFLLLTIACLAVGCQIAQPSADDIAKQEHDMFIDAGEAYLDEELLESALIVFNKALEKQDRSYPAHMGIGEVHERRGHHEKAIQHFDTARDIRPDDFRANYKLALNQQMINRLHEAATNYLSALSINPDDYEANFNLAVTYLQLGRPRLGRPYAEKAVELNSQAQTAQSNLGTIYLNLGMPKAAAETYEEALTLGALARPIQSNLAEAYVDSRQYPKAAKLLAKLIEGEPDAWGYERLGFVLYKQRKFKESQAVYEKALGLDGKYIPALNGMGIAMMAQYIQDGRRQTAMRDKAIGYWQSSIKLRPEQPRIIDLISRFQKL